jgi:hypothetical protein
MDEEAVLAAGRVEKSQFMDLSDAKPAAAQVVGKSSVSSMSSLPVSQVSGVSVPGVSETATGAPVTAPGSASVFGNMANLFGSSKRKERLGASALHLRG